MSTQWHGCYESGWKGVITPDSFAHPAKFSRSLIERIFQHCLERGYLKKGQSVGDCFGGIGTGGIIAAYAGLEWIGCELEERFVKMAEANFSLHQPAWTTMHLPWPRMIQGDSRNFDVLLGEDYDAMVSSPPYADTTRGNERCGIDWDKAAPTKKTSGRHQAPGASASTEYGASAGQIGQLKSGSVDSVVSSPPYSDIAAGAGGLNTKPAKKEGQQSGRNHSPSQSGNWSKDLLRYGKADGQISRLKSGSVEAVVSSPPYISGGHHPDQTGAWNTNGKGQNSASTPTKETANYGATDGQIGALKPGDVDAVVTSPPYGGDVVHARPSKMAVELHQGRQCATGLGEYGGSQGQIQGEGNETYWSAMSEVYRACFRAIKPGGVIVLVLKNYVKNRKEVMLCDDTVRLLEHIGFVTVERIRAMLKVKTVHNDLFCKEGVTTVKSRASFFRRLAEKKGAPPIDWEEVIICRRPNV